ncbi:MAG: hypothetical protein NXH85_14755 [Pseudomonadaceae bacterium]|nr:hypothetical protein [Pseudomonadaceae bacterium]
MSTTIDPWHEPLLRRLDDALAADRLPQGLILAGQSGWGQGVLAARIAEKLLGLPLGRVDDEFAHPDLRWEKPGGKKVYKVEQARSALEFVANRPSNAPRKVLVLTEGDRFNEATANALLKTLEEPPPNNHIIIPTSALAQMLPTIRSRMQVWRVASVGFDVVAPWLLERGVPQAAIDDLLFELGGAPEHVLDAFNDGARPIGTDLAELRGGGKLQSVVSGWSDQQLDLLLARWYRHLRSALAGEGMFAGLSTPALLNFADELQGMRRFEQMSNAPNRTLILERLGHLWAQI